MSGYFKLTFEDATPCAIIMEDYDSWRTTTGSGIQKHITLSVIQELERSCCHSCSNTGAQNIWALPELYQCWHLSWNVDTDLFSTLRGNRKPSRNLRWWPRPCFLSKSLASTSNWWNLSYIHNWKFKSLRTLASWPLQPRRDSRRWYRWAA